MYTAYEMLIWSILQNVCAFRWRDCLWMKGWRFLNAFKCSISCCLVWKRFLNKHTEYKGSAYKNICFSFQNFCLTKEKWKKQKTTIWSDLNSKNVSIDSFKNVHKKRRNNFGTKQLFLKKNNNNKTRSFSFVIYSKCPFYVLFTVFSFIFVK